MREQYVLFGAGVTSYAAVNYFIKEKIVAVIDNSPVKIGTLFEGIPVISFYEYLEKYRDIKIIVSIYSKNYFDVKDQLENHGIFDYFTAPPVLYGFNTPEEMAKELLLEKNTNIVFYDVNPISIRMYKWLQNNSDKECSFIKAFKEKGKSRYEDIYSFISLNEASVKDILVITTNEVEEHIRELLNLNFSGELYDIYKKTNSLHPELIAYKDKHRGERCFIIGNGPSLKSDDLDKIDKNGDISFASNRIFYIFENTQWRPTYYTTIENKRLGIDTDRLVELVGGTLFFADYYYTDLQHDNRINYFSMINRIYENTVPLFSDDITKGVASGRTVTYAMIQIACYMGFSEIYLLGVDFTWGENGSDTHFCKNYEDDRESMIQRTQAVLDKQEICNAYYEARRYSEQCGIKIYNATRGGKLNVFERIDFDTLF